MNKKEFCPKCLAKTVGVDTKHDVKLKFTRPWSQKRREIKKYPNRKFALWPKTNSYLVEVETNPQDTTDQQEHYVLQPDGLPSGAPSTAEPVALCKLPWGVPYGLVGIEPVKEEEKEEKEEQEEVQYCWEEKKITIYVQLLVPITVRAKLDKPYDEGEEPYDYTVTDIVNKPLCYSVRDIEKSIDEQAVDHILKELLKRRT